MFLETKPKSIPSSNHISMHDSNATCLHTSLCAVVIVTVKSQKTKKRKNERNFLDFEI